ncbi:MAG: ATP-binding protein [Nitrospinae bacterium]|nr:ATP-binding protein [Nitrospinota bacterium]
MSFENLTIWVRNFKCFGAEGGGFLEIKPFNLIIGRNNSGKSSLLDLVAYMVTTEFSDLTSDINHKDTNPVFEIIKPLEEKELIGRFPQNASGGPISGSHWEFARKYLLGQKIKVGYTIGSKKPEFIELENLDLPLECQQDRFISEFLRPVASHINNPLKGKTVKRILAERDIRREQDADINVQGNGTGITNIIQRFINLAELPGNEVEINILNDLNEIFGSDGNFQRIICQKLPNNSAYWEIFIDEEEKGRIALSNSGSGLKTIIIILVFLRLLPIQEKVPLGDYFFCFEELENNLHPALLRRFLSFIYKICIETGCIVFLTTHSNVSIDVFSKNPHVQIIHVTHNNGVSVTSSVKTYIENKGILDDLDVRASDLLQSNGIVWVEGPSDRIYFNRWIELWTNGELTEGTHYQCIFYGGRLLAHLDASSPDEFEENGVSILRVNRNSLILIDSDKKSERARVNATKQRIAEEIEGVGGLAWVTKGKEIENYIPFAAVTALLGIKTEKQVERFQNFFEYLDDIKQSEGKKYNGKKPLFAEKIIPHLTLENSRDILDLNEKMVEAIQHINRWNSIEDD